MANNQDNKGLNRRELIASSMVGVTAASMMIPSEASAQKQSSRQTEFGLRRSPENETVRFTEL